MNQPAKLRRRLAEDAIIVAPGIYDALSAFRAEAAGFEAVFVSGSALAATHLARPDIGLMTASETADIVARIGERIAIPMFVDADQGFGNTFAVARTVKAFERAGASAIQIEDQQEVKSAKEPLSRPLITAEKMADKIKAAKDALVNQDMIISARTDAVSSEGFEAALERAHIYAEAGADMLFVESLSQRSQMEELVRQIERRVPLLHNFLRPQDEVNDAATAQTIGYSVALFPSTALSAIGSALDDSLSALARSPRLETTSTAPDRIGARDFLAS
jgi:2-methylisocitrate lyase-like PEP mutase family enzyme